MSNALTTTKQTEKELISVLQSSLYPSASIPSVQMVLNYCVAAGLDPMQKPVHIVPIWDSKAGAMRDVVMPGIGLYRTQAARSGNYAGVSDAEYGPDVTEKLGGLDITYPTWCKVSVKRLLPSGQVAEFSATERWKENYAVRGGKDKSIAPNAMWAKRPYGQLAKCAEAQALRKAFPEFGSQPTADEMEGKEFEVPERDVAPKQDSRPTLEDYSAESFELNYPKWRQLIKDGKKDAESIISMASSKAVLSDEQKAMIRKPVEVDKDGVIDADFVKSFEGAE